MCFAVLRSGPAAGVADVMLHLLILCCIFISVPPDTQIEDAGRSPAPLKTEKFVSNQKADFDVET